MPGRGDNNKSGSAGRGASNQSNQPFVADSEKEPKSNHGKKTGGSASEKMIKQKYNLLTETAVSKETGNRTTVPTNGYIHTKIEPGKMPGFFCG